jgi:hypothetical protein
MAVDIRRICREMIGTLDAVAESDDDVEITIVPAADNDNELPDPEELELGVTELLPTMRKPRWTPQLELPVVPSRKPITPRNQRDQVSGEIVPRRLLK